MSNEQILRQRLREAHAEIRRLEEQLREFKGLRHLNRDRRDYLKQYGRRKYRDATASTVYVIAAGGQLKVGKTVNLAARLRTLRVSHPSLALLHSVSGYTTEERDLHARLSALRVSREWFQDTPAARKIVDAWVWKQRKSAKTS
jgi:hypothetical protein